MITLPNTPGDISEPSSQLEPNEDQHGLSPPEDPPPTPRHHEKIREEGEEESWLTGITEDFLKSVLESVDYK